MRQIIAIANQKGGVGKTTTAVNLAASLAASGYRVLGIDLDPQGNATSSIGITEFTSSSYDLFMEGAMSPIGTQIDGLDFIPGSIDSAALERQLAGADDANFRLRSALTEIEDRYDFVVIDTPPGLGFLTVNALVAADHVIVPVQSEYLALEGLNLMLATVERIKEDLNPELNLSILLTMFDPRLKLARAVDDDIRTKLSEFNIFKTIIQRNVKLAEAPSFGLPIILFDPSSTGSSSYIELSREVIQHEATSTGERARRDIAAPEAPDNITIITERAAAG